MKDVIGGYSLRTLMGTGQTSQVWDVVELSSGKHYAMKILLPEFVTKAEHRQLLTHEAEVGKKFDHPNIIKVYKLVKEPKEAYYIMECFPSTSLKQRIMRKEEQFIREKAQEIFKQVATALAYMHGLKWVHRDVKPDNILVNDEGQVKLIDFAIAKKIEKPGFFAQLFGQKEKPQGTRSYMSPEQIRGESVDGRADIYSFAATAYEVVTGRPPFRGATAQDLLAKHLNEKVTSPQVLNPDVTDEFAALVVRMLAKKREERPQNFHEVLMQLKSMRVFKSKEIQKKA
ncbi:MAG: serine/threonine protein kinase [Gemmataceae bacterium]|nr:serine/threonine protein kinase [Gemmataceae bacterium]MDW8263917.1 serine/threonine-protein kinase [Gemmataceae bacterium]